MVFQFASIFLQLHFHLENTHREAQVAIHKHYAQSSEICIYTRIGIGFEMLQTTVYMERTNDKLIIYKTRLCEANAGVQ